MEKNLTQLATEIKTNFISKKSQLIDTVDEREEFDMYLENLEHNCQFIADELQNQPEAFESVLDLSKTIKSSGYDSIAKDLEIGLAYASNQRHAA